MTSKKIVKSSQTKKLVGPPKFAVATYVAAPVALKPRVEYSDVKCTLLVVDRQKLSDLDHQNLSHKLSKLGLDPNVKIPLPVSTLGFSRVESPQVVNRFCHFDAGGYYDMVVTHVVDTGEVWFDTLSVLERDGRALCADLTGHNRISCGRPCAYLPHDPLVSQFDFPEFSTITYLFSYPRGMCLHNLVFHRSIIRLLEMSLVNREVETFVRHDVDWFEDSTDGVYAAGLIDLGDRKGKPLASFRGPPTAMGSGTSSQLVRTSLNFSVSLVSSSGLPDSYLPYGYPMGYKGDCFVHPVLDFYFQKLHWDTGNVYDGLLWVKPEFPDYFVVNGDSDAASLVRASWADWVVLVSGSYVWANYVTLHCESRLYVIADYAVYRALEILVGFSKLPCEASTISFGTPISFWRGEKYVTFPKCQPR